MKVTHPGRYDDPIDDDAVHGAVTVPSEPVGSVISHYPTTDIMRFQLDRLEDVYASTRREPLGQSFVRGHALPPDLASGAVPFGVPGEVKPTSSVVKDLVFPPEKDTPMLGDDRGSDAHRMYVKTHGAYAPGERVSRDYDWAAAGVDPTRDAFGATTTKGEQILDGVAKAINPLKDATSKAASAVIVNKRAEAARAINKDPLGAPRRLGTGLPTPPPDHAFGAPSRRAGADDADEWDAGRLIKGDYAAEDQAPDPTIGKSMTFQGYRRGGEWDATNASRAYGVPSTRRDLAPPPGELRGLADTTSYGDEATAAALINPGYGADRGVVESDYAEAMAAEEMKALYAATGIPVGDGEFEAAFREAAGIDGIATGPNQVATLATFQAVRVRKMTETAVMAR